MYLQNIFLNKRLFTVRGKLVETEACLLIFLYGSKREVDFTFLFLLQITFFTLYENGILRPEPQANANKGNI